MPTLRDGSQASDERFDLLLTAKPDAPTSEWKLGKIVNQGTAGRCTAAALTHFLNAGPAPMAVTITTVIERAYWPAQKADTFPGGSYPGAQPQKDGTSLPSLMKAAKQSGLLADCGWTESEKEIRWALTRRPVIVGIPWYHGMEYPDKNGLCAMTGAMEGGHCICLLGFRADWGLFKFANSRGKKWGAQGYGWLPAKDMQRLLDGPGLCAIPTKGAA